MTRDAYDWTASADDRHVSTSSERNRDPILGVLRRVLPPEGLVLEVASGTGTHAAHFVRHLPGVRWQPTDLDPVAHRSIEGWRVHLDDPRLLPPLSLDVTADWPDLAPDAIFCANMIHIAPWRATLGLLSGGGRVLRSGAPLVLYGPFHEGGPTSESNAAFDARLRARDPSWGVRELSEVQAAAEDADLVLEEVVPMPANNRTVVFRRR